MGLDVYFFSWDVLEDGMNSICGSFASSTTSSCHHESHSNKLKGSLICVLYSWQIWLCLVSNTLSSSLMRASTMGTISTVVDVLEIHMDKNMVVTIIPSSNLGITPGNIWNQSLIDFCCGLPSWVGTNENHDSQGDPLVQVAPLDRQSHDHTPHGHHIAFIHVIVTDLTGAEDTH